MTKRALLISLAIFFGLAVPGSTHETPRPERVNYRPNDAPCRVTYLMPGNALTITLPCRDYDPWREI